MNPQRLNPRADKHDEHRRNWELLGSKETEVTPAETADGAITEFTLPSAPKPGTLVVFVNGIRVPSSAYVTRRLAGNPPFKITFTVPPAAAAAIVCDYWS